MKKKVNVNRERRGRETLTLMNVDDLRTGETPQRIHGTLYGSRVAGGMCKGIEDLWNLDHTICVVYLGKEGILREVLHTGILQGL